MANQTIAQIQQSLQELSQLQVVAGIFPTNPAPGQPNLQVLAVANEYGATLQAQPGQWIAIPAAGVAPTLLPSSVPNLFQPRGQQVLALPDAHATNGYRILFYLVKSVQVSERAFLRKTLEQQLRQGWAQLIETGLDQILAGQLTTSAFADKLGQRMVRDVRQTLIGQMISVPSADLMTGQTEVDLTDLSALYKALDYRVVSGYEG